MVLVVRAVLVVVVRMVLVVQPPESLREESVSYAVPECLFANFSRASAAR